jgi:hypothetical protein
LPELTSTIQKFITFSLKELIMAQMEILMVTTTHLFWSKFGWLAFASVGSTVVEWFPHHPKVKSSRPGAAAVSRGDKMAENG